MKTSHLLAITFLLGTSYMYAMENNNIVTTAITPNATIRANGYSDGRIDLFYAATGQIIQSFNIGQRPSLKSFLSTP